MGAAYLAGLAEKVWGSTDEISQAWQLDQKFLPQSTNQNLKTSYETWQTAVKRSMNWIN
jgi:glycerol kinase